MTYINPKSRLVVVEEDAPRWRRFTVPHTALQAAAALHDIELFQLPAKHVIQAVRLRHTAQFAGVGITAYTVSIGIVGTLAKYAPAFDVFQVVGVQQLSNIPGTESPTVATSIRIAAISGGANLNLSNAGNVEVSVLYGKS